MQKIIPSLWFDSEAEETVKFYTSLFDNSSVRNTTHYTKAGFEIHGQPEGKVMTVEYELDGFRFIALNGGPLFKLNPSISFLIACKTKDEADQLWQKLADNGSVLMELGKYPFSDKYGWMQDKYNLSWQVMFTKEAIKQKITPTLMFTKNQYGKAEEAVNFYASVFHNTNVGDIMRYDENESPDREGTIKHISFTLEGQEFAAMDSARAHDFSFNEAVSLMVECKDQQEIDYFWERLTKGGDPNAQQCGWLKDKFGVSWQIVPLGFEELMNDPDKEKVERITNRFLKMKKIDIAELEKVQ